MIERADDGVDFGVVEFSVISNGGGEGRAPSGNGARTPGRGRRRAKKRAADGREPALACWQLRLALIVASASLMLICDMRQAGQLQAECSSHRTTLINDDPLDQQPRDSAQPSSGSWSKSASATAIRHKGERSRARGDQSTSHNKPPNRASQSRNQTRNLHQNSADDALDLPRGGGQTMGSMNLQGPNSNAINPFMTNQTGDQQQQAQITITPRLELIRVPANSSTVLKCLISWASRRNNRKRPVEVLWSRLVHSAADEDEPSGQHEQLWPAPTIANQTAASGDGGDEESGARKRSPRQTGKSAEMHQAPPQQTRLLRTDFGSRSRQEVKFISDLLSEASLTISAVEPLDSGLYFCRPSSQLSAASGGHERLATIELLVLSRPVVRLERAIVAKDSRSALLLWSVLIDGNTPIKSTVLLVRNETGPPLTGASSNNDNANARDKGRHWPLARPNAANEEQGSALLPSQSGATLTNADEEAASSSRLVIDGQNLHWQRFDLEGEGERAPTTTPTGDLADSDSMLPSAGSGPTATSGLWSDIDVTSSAAANDQQQQHHSKWANQNMNSNSKHANNRRRWPSSRQRRSFNLSSLVPGGTYHMKLAAINDMGQSDWSELTLMMPNELPAPISEVFLLSRKLDSLTIGWRRPSFDNAKTIRYQMQLIDLHRNHTLTTMMDTEHVPQGSQRTNFMYIFVNLQPGTEYHFQVRPCSKFGCTEFSTPKLLASTLDGEPDEPVDVELSCLFELPGRASSAPETNKLAVSWIPPPNPRGQILNYTIQLEARSSYRNQSAQFHLDQWTTTLETGDNHTLSLEADQLLSPNTNYTARVCANNRSKHCGRLSLITTKSQCSVPGALPSELPTIKLESRPLELAIEGPAGSEGQQPPRSKLSIESLMLELPYISSRNGSIDCIQIILIRLPSGFSPDTPLSRLLPPSPDEIELSQSLEQLRARTRSPGIPSEGGISGSSDEWPANKSTVSTGSDPTRTESPPSQTTNDEEPATEQTGGAAAASSSQAPSQHVTRRILANPVDPANSVNAALAASDPNNKMLNVKRTGMTRKTVYATNPRAPTNYWNAELLAYIADELDESSWQWTRLANGEPQLLMMGDGNQHKCQSFTNKLQSLAGVNRNLHDSMAPVFDAQLWPRTYYTGFVKLLAFSGLASSSGSGQGLKRGAPFSAGGERVDDLISVKYSAYFEPTRTGDSVPQIAQLVGPDGSSSFHGNSDRELSEGIGANSLGPPAPELSANSLLLLARDWFTRLGSSARFQASKWTDSSSRFLAENARLDSLANFIMNSSPMMQLLEVGLIVMLLTFLILTLVYLITLPSVLRNKRLRRRKQRECLDRRRRLSKTKELANSNQVEQQANVSEPLNSQSSAILPDAPVSWPSPVQLHDEQQHQQQQAALTTADLKLECPIHSSPLIRSSPIHNQQRPPATTQTGPHHHQHHGSSSICEFHKQATYHEHPAQQQHQLAYHTDRNCRTMRHSRAHSHVEPAPPALYGNARHQQAAIGNGDLTLRHEPNSVLALAKKISKPIPLRLFSLVFESRLRNGWLRDEYDQLPRSSLVASIGRKSSGAALSSVYLQPELIVSRQLGDQTKLCALVSGNDSYDASLIRHPSGTTNGHSEAPTPTIICARSPMDADSVWDFYRLIIEQEVSSIVMLTHTEDPQSGDLRCAQYWPSFDNEETTIMSPRNEFVQSSPVPPAKFKIRQETLESGDNSNPNLNSNGPLAPFKLRRLTLMVLPNRETHNLSAADDATQSQSQVQLNEPDLDSSLAGEESLALDEEPSIIERTILHFQFTHWNMSTLANQMRLIKFIEETSERHGASHEPNQCNQSMMPRASPGPLLVHCTNGLGRSGLFAAMLTIIDELRLKLAQFNDETSLIAIDGHDPDQHLIQAGALTNNSKINLFQLVARMRAQREMLVSPYRFYELLYQLTCNCIPSQQQQQLHQLQLHQQPDLKLHPHDYHYHHHHHQQYQQHRLQ